MVGHPLRISVKPYRGKDQRKQVRYREKLELAQRIEEHINAAMATSYHRVFCTSKFEPTAPTRKQSTAFFFLWIVGATASPS